MYLVSLYFDEETNKKIQGFMKCAAENSGNTNMMDNNVPPHITLTAFESREREAVLIEKFDETLRGLSQGDIKWVSVAAFFPQVLYLVPVLNDWLHGLLEGVCCALVTCSDTQIQDCYRPFNWIPHTTVARRLSGEQMQKAFVALQESFVPFEGSVVRIGLSTGLPKRELKAWNLR